MKDMSTVNIEYIPVIRQYGNLVKLESVDIDKPISLLSALKSILENNEMTILDLQAKMCEYFNEDNRGNIRFLSPDSYYSTYVRGVDFPNIYNNEEYDELLQDLEDEISDKYFSQLQSLREKDGETQYKKALENYLADSIKKKKAEYYRDCIRYIDASCYQQTINRCTEDNSIKMHSVEEDGWCFYEHIINEDITISVSTNFGYGNSTYFFLNLKYKGISILPYSYIVTYYYANMRDICKCTRNYYARAENWNLAFRFVERAVNLAATDEEKFCNEFIKEEIDTMLKGLERVVRSPYTAVNKFVSSVVGDPRETYLGVRNIDGLDISRYNAYPEDMPTAFMAEKIMNANYILSNLCSLSKVYPIAAEAREKVQELINEARPKILESYSKNTNRIQACEIERKNLKKEIEILKRKEAEHDKIIDAIYKEHKATKFRSEIKKEYEESNAEYRQIKENLLDNEQKFTKLGSECYVRNTFIIRLTDCLEAIS